MGGYKNTDGAADKNYYLAVRVHLYFFDEKKTSRKPCM